MYSKSISLGRIRGSEYTILTSYVDSVQSGSANYFLVPWLYFQSHVGQLVAQDMPMIKVEISHYS